MSKHYGNSIGCFSPAAVIAVLATLLIVSLGINVALYISNSNHSDNQQTELNERQ